LFHEPYRFDFFQAVRLMERLMRERADQDRRWPRQAVGGDQPPDQEAVRFRSAPSLAFASAEVQRIQTPQPTEAGSFTPSEMVVTFLGLFGPQGVLPQHYTALVIRRLRDKDTSLRDFLDLLTHRTVSLFYRAWEKYRLVLGYERARLDGREPAADPATGSLYCLAGLGTQGLRGHLNIDDEAFLYYGGHFAHYPRSAIGLECLLEDYFELRIRVQQAQGQWLTLDANDRSLLPAADRPQGLNCELGINLIVGERIWNVQASFRVRVGPLDYAAFGRFMPTGAGLRALGQLARSYVGPEFDFDVQPVLRAAEVPWCQLAGDGAYLGWNSWVRCQAFNHDVGDAVFAAEGDRQVR
jgi:type VI secretion system protein ImpH